MKISEMQVGKKYNSSYMYEIYECVAVVGEMAALKSKSNMLILAIIPEEWTEHKELITLTRYIPIIKEISSSEIRMLTCLHVSEEVAIGYVKAHRAFWELIEIVPVTWTEKT